MALRIKSIYKDLLMEFSQLELARGIKMISMERYMNYFDDFINDEEINEIIFTEEMVTRWSYNREHEGEATKYIRIIWSIKFLTFVRKKGFNINIPRIPKHVGTKFRAYIFSDEEMTKYFKAIDSFYSNNDPFVALYLPVLFRLLYSSGTRIGETLSIRVEDVDLDKGLIDLKHTKNGKERIIVVSDSMRSLLIKYSSKCLYLKRADDYFFSHIDNRRVDEQSIYHWHRRALKVAGIPYKGNGEGPRLHDLRHTFAVKSLVRFEKSGYDLYNALPILSKYLGHTNISATEKYLQLANEEFKTVIEKADEISKEIVGETNEG